MALLRTLVPGSVEAWGAGKEPGRPRRANKGMPSEGEADGQQHATKATAGKAEVKAAAGPAQRHVPHLGQSVEQAQRERLVGGGVAAQQRHRRLAHADRLVLQERTHGVDMCFG